MTSPLSAIASQLDELMLRDKQRLMRRIQGAKKVKKSESQQAIADTLAIDLANAMQRVEARRAACPKITYPESLPVSQKKMTSSPLFATTKWLSWRVKPVRGKPPSYRKFVWN